MPALNALTLADIVQGAAGLPAEQGNSLLEIERGLYLGRTNLAVRNGVTHESESIPFAAFSVLLEGVISTDATGMQELAPDAALIVANNERRRLVSSFHSAERLRNVEVFVTPEWFEADMRRFGADSELDALQQSMTRPLQGRRTPLDPRHRQLAAMALDMNASGPVAALRLEAWTLDLLCELISSFRPDLRAAKLAPRDHDRVHAIHALIAANPGGVSGVTALAQAHGVSASKLKRDFFLAFGCCIGGYVNEQRLERARYLLEQGMAVSQAAWAVGYAHPANFSTAFRRRFGLSPRMYGSKHI